MLEEDLSSFVNGGGRHERNARVGKDKKRTRRKGRTRKPHFDEEDIGDANQGGQVVLLLGKLAVGHGLKLTIMNGEVWPKVTGIWQGCDESSQRCHSS